MVKAYMLMRRDFAAFVFSGSAMRNGDRGRVDSRRRERAAKLQQQRFDAAMEWPLSTPSNRTRSLRSNVAVEPESKNHAILRRHSGHRRLHRLAGLRDRCSTSSRATLNDEAEFCPPGRSSGASRHTRAIARWIASRFFVEEAGERSLSGNRGRRLTSVLFL